MDKLDEISRQRKKAQQKLVSLKSKVTRRFSRWSKPPMRTVLFPKRQRS